MNRRLFMKKDPKIFLKHILESIEEIEKYTTGVSGDKFFRDSQMQDAVIRRLEIIGEAVKNLPLAFRKKHVHIPWKEMGGMRDILIHEYFGVDIDLVWKVVEKDIPALKRQISVLLKDLNDGK